MLVIVLLSCSCIGLSTSHIHLANGWNQALVRFATGLPTTGDLCTFGRKRNWPGVDEEILSSIKRAFPGVMICASAAILTTS